ncbi:MAG: hypothetical protein QXM46_05390 [Candidatus Hadarchaeales archaeon]
MKVPCTIKRDFEVDLGEGVSSWREGERVELEHWQLRVLRKHELVEPLEQVGLAAVRKLLLSEGRQPGLQPLPQGFYVLLAEEMEYLRSKGEESLEDLKKAVEDFLELRLQKLVRLSLFPSQAKGALPEERVLLEELSGGIEEWRRWMTRRLKVGENEGRRTLREMDGEKPDLQKP